MSKFDSSAAQEQAQICLQCPACEVISPVAAEEAALLSLSARALIECPQCHTQFSGEPQRVLRFFNRARDITRLQASTPPPEYPPK